MLDRVLYFFENLLIISLLSWILWLLQLLFFFSTLKFLLILTHCIKRKKSESFKKSNYFLLFFKIKSLSKFIENLAKYLARLFIKQQTKILAELKTLAGLNKIKLINIHFFLFFINGNRKKAKYCQLKRNKRPFC